MHRSTLGSLVLLAIVIISDVLARKDYEGPTVNTRFGPVRGRLMLSARRNLLSAFLGIPYAQPPIGELRFQSPQPWNGTWTEPRDATVDGFQCAQILKSRIIVGNEDCLFLNIFVPHKMLGYDDRLEGGSRKMPVIVFVHGGAFTNGNSFSWVYAPDYLLDQEVVLVTINYRVGVLGFFSTGDQNAPGNYGLKDIWMALVWINENIVNFGGDPNLVTLMGQEAGAAAVHLLSLSSKTEGLFQRIITQSGSALAPWAFHSKENIRNVSLELARLCNCYIERQNPETTMNCLRDTNLTCIVNMSTFYTVWDDNPWFVFGPTEELESDEAIITRHPLLQIQRGLFRDIPWIIGITADEGLVKTINIITNQTMKAELLNDPEYILPYLLEYEQVVSNVSQFVQTLMEFYFEHNPLDYNDILFRQHNITEMVNDAMMRWPLYQTLRMQADQMTSDVFYYLFSFEGTFSVSFAHGVERYGTSTWRTWWRTGP
ncbi:esterase FE4 isoform X2 [Orussus abietinus]|uniref:esterase FE4 isoform X2 n=1 Tax=Orussus abietinus TaxID=222816 RepID=UPI000625CBAC|nr:esterase FE4 isoform X2 [Orussus abietinus]